MAYIKLEVDGSIKNIKVGLITGLTVVNGSIVAGQSRPKIEYFGDVISSKFNFSTAKSVNLVKNDDVKIPMVKSTNKVYSLPRGTEYTQGFGDSNPSVAFSPIGKEKTPLDLIENEEIMWASSAPTLYLYHTVWNNKYYAPLRGLYTKSQITSNDPIRIPNTYSAYPDVMYFQIGSNSQYIIGISPTNFTQTAALKNISPNQEITAGGIIVQELGISFNCIFGQYSYGTNFKNLFTKENGSPLNPSGELYTGSRGAGYYTKKNLGTTARNYIVVSAGNEGTGALNISDISYILINSACLYNTDVTPEPPDDGDDGDDGGGDGGDGGGG